MRKFRWIDLALLPFGLCVLFLLLLGKLFGLTYKQISVVFNLWLQGAVLALSGVGSTLIWNQDGFAPFLKSVHGSSFRNMSGSIESAYKKGGKFKNNINAK